MYLLTVAHLRQRLVSFHLWFPPFPPFPPFLRSSETPKLRHPTTQSHHYAVTSSLRFSVSLLLRFPSLFHFFSFLFICFSAFLELRNSDTPILQFSGSLEFRSYGELFNLHFFTFFTFINGLMVVSFFASIISVPRDPVSQGPLFHRP